MCGDFSGGGGEGRYVETELRSGRLLPFVNINAGCIGRPRDSSSGNNSTLELTDTDSPCRTGRADA